MKKRKNRIEIWFSAIFVVLLLLPSAQYFFRLFPEGNLYGYVEKKATRPDSILRGWFNKDLQRWWGDAFDSNIGFKPIGVRIFNEITFRIFAEAPRLKLYSTKAHGLYSQMSIDSLNYEFVNREALSKQYLEFSGKIVKLQRLLARSGKYMEVVISSSKPYVYPDGLGKRFLVNTDNDIFPRTASIGRELEKHGVNVIDSGPLLRQFYKRTLIETHPYSGVHWNYYSGCIVTRELLSDARQFIANTPKLYCGDPVYKNPTMVDVDGLLLLNVLSDVGIARPSPYPSPTAEFLGGYKPKILIVGDSFLDQMVFSLKASRAYSRLVTSVYFGTREVHGQVSDSPSESSLPLPEEQIRASLIEDAFDSDLIVLQMVDYNVSRLGYGFVDSLLKHFSDLDRHGDIRIESVAGAYDRESDGQNWWHWVEHKLIFTLQARFVPDDATKTKLRFEYGTRGKQTLALQITKRDGSSQEVLLQMKGNAPALFDQVIDVPPSELSGISIETDGKAFPLGDRDPRMAAWMIRNVNITPVSP